LIKRTRAYTQHNTNPQAAAKQYKHATNWTDAESKNRIRNTRPQQRNERSRGTKRTGPARVYSPRNEEMSLSNPAGSRAAVDPGWWRGFWRGRRREKEGRPGPGLRVTSPVAVRDAEDEEL
jgi:hypothetical protein